MEQEACRRSCFLHLHLDRASRRCQSASLRLPALTFFVQKYGNAYWVCLVRATQGSRGSKRWPEWSECSSQTRLSSENSYCLGPYGALKSVLLFGTWCYANGKSWRQEAQVLVEMVQKHAYAPLVGATAGTLCPSPMTRQVSLWWDLHYSLVWAFLYLKVEPYLEGSCECVELDRSPHSHPHFSKVLLSVLVVIFLLLCAELVYVPVTSADQLLCRICSQHIIVAVSWYKRSAWDVMSKDTVTVPQWTYKHHGGRGSVSCSWLLRNKQDLTQLLYILIARPGSLLPHPSPPRAYLLNNSVMYHFYHKVH